MPQTITNLSQSPQKAPRKQSTATEMTGLEALTAPHTRKRAPSVDCFAGAAFAAKLWLMHAQGPPAVILAQARIQHPSADIHRRLFWIAAFAAMTGELNGGCGLICVPVRG